MTGPAELSPEVLAAINEQAILDAARAPKPSPETIRFLRGVLRLHEPRDPNRQHRAA